MASASGKRQHHAPVSPEGRGLHMAPRGGKGEWGESTHWLENMCEVVGERAGKLYFNLILEERGKSYWNDPSESRNCNLLAFISQNGAWHEKCLNKCMSYWCLLRARCSLLLLLLTNLMSSPHHLREIGIYFFPFETHEEFWGSVT